MLGAWREPNALALLGSPMGRSPGRPVVSALARVKAANPAILRGFHRLAAITRRWLIVASNPLSVMRRNSRVPLRQVGSIRQAQPLEAMYMIASITSRSTAVRGPPASARRRRHRLNPRPFPVAQIAWITRALTHMLLPGGISPGQVLLLSSRQRR